MHNGTLITIRDKELYVEVHGSSNLPPLLYLHGGPGESCFDFSYHQAERLEDNFMVIAIDQRGVCRSEAVTEEENFGLCDLIEDCEAIRKHFGLESWSVLGHSFGGYLGVHYATQYPEAIDHLLLECPTFDFTLTSRSLMKKTSRLLEKFSNQEAAIECMAIAQNEKIKNRELAELYTEYSDLLGEDRMEIYIHNDEQPTDYSYYSEAKWDELYDKSEVHYNLLREEGEIFDSLLPVLHELSMPTLLLTGEHDPVTCQEQITVFKEVVKNGAIYHFSNSGHTPHDEEADHFAYAITQFIGDKRED
ncbi:MAG: alpha/beta hydrolase [Anaerobacillus sp.]